MRGGWPCRGVSARERDTASASCSSLSRAARQMPDAHLVRVRVRVRVRAGVRVRVGVRLSVKYRVRVRVRVRVRGRCPTRTRRASRRSAAVAPG